jgi:hypothetical protein
MKKETIKDITRDELYNLDLTIINFLLPRLRKFKKENFGYPTAYNQKQWNSILGEIISACEQYQREICNTRMTTAKMRKIKLSLHKLIDNLDSLWY